MTHKIPHKLALSVCIGLFAAASAQAQTVWFVDAAAPPFGDGMSWANAFNGGRKDKGSFYFVVNLWLSNCAAAVVSTVAGCRRSAGSMWRVRGPG